MPEKVLVVDDDDAIRRLLSAVLKRAGFGADEARHGGEALTLIQKNRYSVMVLDLMMPVMSGFEVLDWLTEHDREQLQCVIVITAASDRAISRLDSATVFQVIRKPFDLELIVKTVRECARSSTPGE